MTTRWRKAPPTPQPGALAPPEQLSLLDTFTTSDPPASDPPGLPSNRHQARQRPTSVLCGWCGNATAVNARGRIPTWCSDACRHRAWEQRRAASSGLCAVRVVDREVEVVRTITEVQQMSVLAEPATVEEWAQVLSALTDRLDRGRIYDRDVRLLLPTIAGLVEAMNRRCR